MKLFVFLQMKYQNSKDKMETEKIYTYEERRNIKREALAKLDQLIEDELKRLYEISPNKPNLEEFEICTDGDYFTSLELEEIRNNIAKLRKISSKNNEAERNEAIIWLKIALQFRPILWPWE